MNISLFSTRICVGAPLTTMPIHPGIIGPCAMRGSIVAPSPKRDSNATSGSRRM